jgi:hypothetical protein
MTDPTVRRIEHDTDWCCVGTPDSPKALAAHVTRIACELCRSHRRPGLREVEKLCEHVGACSYSRLEESDELAMTLGERVSECVKYTAFTR